MVRLRLKLVGDVVADSLQDAPWQVQADHTNQFVYNTEAHPIRVAAGRERVRR